MNSKLDLDGYNKYNLFTMASGNVSMCLPLTTEATFVTIRKDIAPTTIIAIYVPTFTLEINITFTGKPGPD